MTYHFIAIASDFDGGLRIGWHYASNDRLDSKVIDTFLDKAIQKGDISFGMHKLTTDSLSWESVVKKDSFFEDVFAVGDMDEFLERLYDDTDVSALDVARVIISMMEVTQLKLQKLVYLCYAEYLTKFKEKLFNEKLVAYKYGPVIEEVYSAFREYGYNTIHSVDDDSSYFRIKDSAFNPVFMKVLNSENGLDKALSIIESIQYYGEYSASELVSLTHQDDTPWDLVYQENWNNQITDELILEFHKNELELSSN